MFTKHQKYGLLLKWLITYISTLWLLCVYTHLFFLALFQGCRALPASSTNNRSVKLKMSTEQWSTGCL